LERTTLRELNGSDVYSYDPENGRSLHGL